METKDAAIRNSGTYVERRSVSGYFKLDFKAVIDIKVANCCIIGCDSDISKIEKNLHSSHSLKIQA